MKEKLAVRGFRIFPLVASASCGYLLAAQRAFGESTYAQARILQGLITEVGFVGGAAILKYHREVRGVTTAASIFCDWHNRRGLGFFAL